MRKIDIKTYIIKSIEELRVKEMLSMLKKVNIEGNLYKGYEWTSMFPLESLFLVESKLLSSISNKEDNILIKVLMAYLSKVKAFEYLEDAFEEIYSEYLLYIENNEYRYRTVMFLSGIRSEEEIVFDKCKLIPANEEYYGFLCNTWDKMGAKRTGIFDGSITETINMASNTILVSERNLKEANDLDEVALEAESIIKAIILEIGTEKTFSLSPMYTFSYMNKGGMISNIQYIAGLTNREQYKWHNVGDITTVINSYKRINSMNRDFIPINRLISAISKHSLNDRFLDLMIALESIFPNIQHEATYRLALCIATLLDRRESVYKDMKKLYNQRSKIVHGTLSCSKKQGIDIEDYRKLDTILRDVIKIVIDLKNEGIEIESIEEYVMGILLPN